MKQNPLTTALVCLSFIQPSSATVHLMDNLDGLRCRREAASDDSLAFDPQDVELDIVNQDEMSRTLEERTSDVKPLLDSPLKDALGRAYILSLQIKEPVFHFYVPVVVSGVIYRAEARRYQKPGDSPSTLRFKITKLKREYGDGWDSNSNDDVSNFKVYMPQETYYGRWSAYSGTRRGDIKLQVGLQAPLLASRLDKPIAIVVRPNAHTQVLTLAEDQKDRDGYRRTVTRVLTDFSFRISAKTANNIQIFKKIELSSLGSAFDKWDGRAAPDTFTGIRDNPNRAKKFYYFLSRIDDGSLIKIVVFKDHASPLPELVTAFRIERSFEMSAQQSFDEAEQYNVTR